MNLKMKFIMIKKAIYTIVLMLGVSFLQHVTAQDNTLYMMHQIPEVNELNPAIQPEYHGYVQLPGLSSVQAGVHNTGFSYWDAIHYGTGSQSDSLVIDLEQLGSKLGDRNYLRIENRVQLLGFGFRLRDSYITFGISNRVSGRIGYPKDLIDIRHGNFDFENQQTRDLDFSGLGVDLVSYAEIAAGFSTEIIPGLTVGGKIKRLFGSAGVHSQKTDLMLETAQDDYTLAARANMNVRVAYPLDIQRNENGEFDGLEFLEPDPINDLVFNKNGGFAFDVGATYKLDDRFDFSAAIVDLGGIKWKNNTYEFKLNGLYEFDGINASPNEEGQIEIDDEINNIPDTLEAIFNPEVNEGGEYVSMLPTKIFLNANYRLTESVSFSVLNRNLIYDGGLHPELTLGAEISPSNWFTAKLTYSMMNRSYNNLGLGLGIRGSVFQFYILQDNISALLWPEHSRAYTLRLGLNITWGFEQQIDRTLIE